MKAILKANIRDWDHTDFCMTEENYEFFCEHIGETCEVDVEAEFLGECRESSYWFLSFEDGLELDIIGGVHLEFIEEENDG